MMDQARLSDFGLLARDATGMMPDLMPRGRCAEPSAARSWRRRQERDRRRGIVEWALMQGTVRRMA